MFPLTTFDSTLPDNSIPVVNIKKNIHIKYRTQDSFLQEAHSIECPFNVRIWICAGAWQQRTASCPWFTIRSQQFQPYFKFSNFCPISFMCLFTRKGVFFLSERTFSGKLLKHLITKRFITQDHGHVTPYMTSHFLLFVCRCWGWPQHHPPRPEYPASATTFREADIFSPVLYIQNQKDGVGTLE